MAHFVTRLRQYASLATTLTIAEQNQTKLLTQRELKQKRVLDLAAAMEASERQAAQMARDPEPVNMVSGARW